MDNFVQDVKYALRKPVGARAFTLAAVSKLAIGNGEQARRETSRRVLVYGGVRVGGVLPHDISQRLVQISCAVDQRLASRMESAVGELAIDEKEQVTAFSRGAE